VLIKKVLLHYQIKLMQLKIMMRMSKTLSITCNSKKKIIHHIASTRVHSKGEILVTILQLNKKGAIKMICHPQKNSRETHLVNHGGITNQMNKKSFAQWQEKTLAKGFTLTIERN
jgi:hypothetical protein